MATPLVAPRAVPGPRSFPPGRQLLRFWGNPLDFVADLARYGDVASVSLGTYRIYLVNRPDLVEQVLVSRAASFGLGRALLRSRLLLGQGLLTSDGELHKRQRRMMQPLFHRQAVARYADDMVRAARAESDTIPAATPFDMTNRMAALTLAIVGETLLSSDVRDTVDEVREALAEAVDTFQFAFLPFSEYLEKLPLPPVRRCLRARERLDAVIFRLIAARRAEGAKGTDLISLLLAAQDPEAPGGTRMSDMQVRDEVLTIFLAGHETTANALAWTWHALATAPEAEARLHAEVDQVLGDRAATMEDLTKLPWTRHVLSESMRLHPPAWTLGRTVLEPVAIDGYMLEPGALVVTSQHLLHRDARYWPEPDRFLPERWERPDPSRPRFAYFPFGGGGRLCIGEAFAWMEGTLLLATLAQRWRFRPAGPPPVPEARMTLRPRGLRMTAEPRR